MSSVQVVHMSSLSSPHSLPETCSKCKKKFQQTEHKIYKMCPKCREYGRTAARRKSELRLRTLLDQCADTEASSSSLPTTPPKKKRKYDELHFKKIKTPSPVKKHVSPEYIPDPDEYPTPADAFSALASYLSAAHTPPNFRLVYNLVADPKLDNVKMVKRACDTLREKTSLRLSPNTHRIHPSVSPYARPGASAAAVKVRCKCADASQTESAGKKGGSDALWSWLRDDGARCGGHVYISSEYDDSSHPHRIRGQRVVVTVVHPPAPR